jgi:hypothetical protein
MLDRAKSSGRALLIALDVLACAVWLAALYPFNLCDKPNGRQTISGYVGKAALHGHKWAFLPERCIDAVIGQGHCLRAYQQGQG